MQVWRRRCSSISGTASEWAGCRGFSWYLSTCTGPSCSSIRSSCRPSTRSAPLGYWTSSSRDSAPYVIQLVYVDRHGRPSLALRARVLHYFNRRLIHNNVPRLQCLMKVNRIGNVGYWHAQYKTALKVICNDFLVVKLNCWSHALI